jgi:ABC-type antimicrobial peptide transport system ATPase subunit
MIILLVEDLGKKIINKIAVRNYKEKFWRKIGLKIEGNNVGSKILKLMVEGYVDLLFAVTLNVNYVAN